MAASVRPRGAVLLVIILAVSQFWSGVSAVTCPALPPPDYGFNYPGAGSCSNPQNDQDSCQQGCGVYSYPTGWPNFREVSGDEYQSCNQGGYSSVPLKCLPVCPALTVTSSQVQIVTGGGSSCAATDYQNNPPYCNMACKDTTNYFGIGNPSRQCLNRTGGWDQTGGKWTGSDFYCVQCPAIPPPSNSLPTLGCPVGSTLGAVCNQTCAANYNNTGYVGVRTCVASSTSASWSVDPGTRPVICTKMCLALTPPTLGSMSGSCSSTSNAGATCTFSCQNGLVLVGSSTTTCDGMGNWNNAVPTCSPQCPAIPAPLNGANVGTSCQATTTDGQLCRQTCNAGYGMRNGTGVIRCGISSVGQWNATGISCVICPEILKPNNGGPGCSNTSVQFTWCNQTCVNNFASPNPQWANRQCLDGVWTGGVFTCIAQCPDIADPQFGDSQCSATIDYVTPCRVSCNAGYQLIGSPARKCLSSGNWNETDPICLPICSAVPQPQWGTIRSGCGQTYTAGANCSITCNAGSVVTGGNTMRYCINGVYNGTALSCTPQCPVVPRPVYANEPSDCPVSIINGSLCAFTCQSGYSGTGSPVRKCINGVYNGTQYDCVQCPMVPATANSNSPSCPAGPAGSLCIQTCWSNATQTGGSVARLCNTNGQWNATALVCNTTCPAIPAPNLGFGACSQTTNIGQLCVQSCQTNADVTGSPVRRCQPDGNWNGTALQCSARCPNIVTPNANTCWNTTDFVTPCTITCNPGYIQVGTYTGRCQNTGNWQNLPVNVVCRQCLSISAALHSSATCATTGLPGSWCYQSCDAGYAGSQSGSGSPPYTPSFFNTTCTTSGTWTTVANALDIGTSPNFNPSSTLNCIAQCPPVPTPVGSNSPSCPESMPGISSCVQACISPGWLAGGSGNRACQLGGNWQGSALSCTPQCPAQTAGTGQTVVSGVCTTSANNNSAPCVITCLPSGGWVQTGGATVRKCILSPSLGGYWNDTQVTCSQNCPVLNAPANAFGSCPSTNVTGSTCSNIKCFDGFTPVVGGVAYATNTSVTCSLPNWSSFSCVQCPAIATPGNATGNCVASKVGATCTQTCLPGYTSSGPLTRTCTISGWSPATPPSVLTCNPVCSALSAPNGGGTQTGTCTANAPVGSICRQACGANYGQFNGTAVRVCGGPGAADINQWNGTAMYCAPICAAISLGSPFDSNVFCPANFNGSLCYLKCLDGYALTGPNPRVCVATPTSQKYYPTSTVACRNCPQYTVAYATSPPSGICVATNITGTNCTVTCLAGFAILDAVAGPTRTCVISDTMGGWNGANQVCSPYCPSLYPEPSNGHLVGSPCNGTFTDGAICGITCNTNYSVWSGGIGCPANGDRTCSAVPATSGKWNGCTPSCVLNCPPYTPPANATGSPCTTTIINGTAVGNCTYSCRPGFRLIGNGTVNCFTGQWVGGPICVPECPDVVAPGNGTITGGCTNTITNGDYCNTTCNPGFSLVGDAVRRCYQGAWNGYPAQCGQCPPVAAPSGGGPSCPTGTQGQACFQNCTAPYYAQSGGNMNRTCFINYNNASNTPIQVWTPPQQLTCAPLCPFVPAPRNGFVDCLATISTAATCQQTCNTPTFTLIGTTVRNCTNGNWTGTPVMCNSTCPAQGALLHGAPACNATTINGAVCGRWCQNGWTQTAFSPVNVTCVAGLDSANWVPNPASAICRQCPLVTAPGNGTATGCAATNTDGAICTLACNQPWYAPATPAQFTCDINTGSWSPTPALTCVPYCNPVAAQPNSGDVCPGTSTPNQVCTTNCNSNAAQTGGNMTRTCINGNWTGSPIQCSLQCPVVNQNSPNTTNSCAKAFAGGWCNQTCGGGYAPAAIGGGSLNRQCQADGSWAGSALYCELQCPFVAAPTNGNSTCAATTDRNAICAQTCQPGYEIVTPTPSRTCQMNGQWSGTAVSCKACPALARPAGVNTSCPLSTSGQVCNVGCKPGFLMSGYTGPLVCGFQTGVWTNSMPTCQSLCPELDPPAGGNGNICGPTPSNGDICIQGCNPGFTTLGNTTRTCNATSDVAGYWTGTQLQCVSECPYLPAPSNGGPACMNTATNYTICNQTCNSGFKTDGGPQPRQCIMQPGVDNGGAWTGGPITCVQCPMLIAPLGSPSANCSATPIDGTVCNMTCLGTYTAFGSNLRTCNDGVWSGTAFSCNLNCPAVPVPQYGAVFCPATPNPTDWCNQTCPVGFYLNGTANRRCNGGFGTWTGTAVTCIPQCPQILAPGNGSVLCPATTTNGQMCNQTCNFGYYNTGSGLVCNNGTWIGTQVTCIPECPDVPAPGNGTQACARTTVMGTTCPMACNPGYAPVPFILQRTCVNGNWTAAPRCLRCEMINAPTGGGPACGPTADNSFVCWQTCNPGYRRQGDQYGRLCTDGTWNGTATTCAPECQPVPTPQYSSSPQCNATISYVQTCVQTCNPGFTLTGSSTRTCQSTGQWSGTAVGCLPTCPIQLPTTNALNTCANSTVNGAFCNQTCKPGFDIDTGSFVRTCDSSTGLWSSSILTCKPQCPAINTPLNGSVSCGATTVYGTWCNQTCMPGFVNNGTLGRSCQSNGAWSGNQVFCIPQCPTVLAPMNGFVDCLATTVVGTWCNQTCTAGTTRFLGTAGRRCINGQWTGTAVSCPLECPFVPTTPHSGSPSCPATITVGDSCAQLCDKWYRNVGTNNRTCLATGSWSGSATTCIEECPFIPAPLYGTPACQATITPGDRCQQTCYPGYLATGDNTLFCQNGNWTGTPVTCTPQCPYLPVPFNGVGSCNATTVDGTHCQQSCLPGTVALGDFDRVCMGGVWNGTRVTCSRCGDYKTCAQCIATDPNCGWCGKTATCMAGDGNGAIGGATCAAYWVSPQSRIVTSSTTANSTVVPTYYQIYLRANQPLIVPVSVYTFRVPLDVYLLQDVSNSFGPDLPTLKQLAPTLIANLTAIVTSDSQFGVGAFIDKPRLDWALESDFVFRPYQTITANTSAVIAQMNALYVTAGSGVDLPEAMLEGLLHTIQCPSVVGWRPNARHMVFLSTDAWFHSRGEGFFNLNYQSTSATIMADYPVQNNEDCVVQTYEDYPSAWQVRAACLKNNVIPIFALSDNGDPIQPQWQRLIDLIGFGGTTPITHDGAGMVDAIKTAYEAASAIILLTEATDVYNLLQSISPIQGYQNVSLDDYRVFQTTFQWDGTIIPPTTVVMNAIGFGSLSVDVSYASCNCTGIPCPISNGLVCGGHGSCDCGLCNCFQGWSSDPTIPGPSDCSCNTNKTCSEFGFCTGHGTCQCGVCKCDSGWGNSNCSCAGASCDASCVPPRGDCACGICTCRAGFYAMNTIGGCDCSAAPCPQNCTFPNGQCDCGTCNCAPGFTGPNCNCTTAPCPNLCSGHGNCSCGTCQCAPGWSGDDCSCSQAPCADPTCGGHGTCVCGQCQCDALYSGSDCTCFNIPCLNNCNAPNGTCECGQCVCNNYTSGADCSCDITKVCPSGPGGVCNGNGDCDCGICSCDFGFTGAACECALVCENDCSGHGTCNCGVCECQPGWSGTDCSCSNATCLNNCFHDEGHGDCICGQCVCDSVHWAGSDCGCSTAPCPDNCFGNGQCVCGECQCNEGYTPPNCTCDASTTCPGPNNNCNGHGTCDCGCICTDGYSGNDCLCFEGPCLGTNGCSGHGNCTCDSCVCEPGYSGFDCSCHSGLACPTNDPAKNCSGHGTCDGCSNCICDTTYFGTPDCSCLNTPCTPDANCSGNGVCTCGQCVCNANWNGTSCECSLLPCAPDPTCGGHGHCECGACVCDQDWITTNASLPCGTCGGASCQPPGPVAACPLLTTCDTCIAGNCRWCPSNSRCYAAPDLPAGSLCSTTVDGTTSCPTGAAAFFGNTVAVSGTAVGIAFLIVFVILAILAILKWLRDRRDYNEWFKASQDVAFTMADNPLHKSQFQTYENRLYEAHE